MLHGGAIAGLLEIAATAAIDATLEDGPNARAIFQPIPVTVDFMRGGRVRDTWAAAIVSRLGNRIANVEAFAWQEDRSKPIASARMNLMVRRAAGGDS